MNVHKTAIVHPKAKLANTISIGPYSIIGKDVSIGEKTIIGAHCIIDGASTIGKNCHIFTGAVIGSIPQDLKFKEEKTSLYLGDNNIIREYVTINLGTKETGRTTVGSNNLIMAYSHIAHDCNIGSNVVIANSVALAGHVTIEDKAIIGGLSGVHQFVHIGTLSIIGGCSKAIQDVPPYSTYDGHPAKFYGLNIIGLKRAGIKEKIRKDIKIALKILLQSGMSTSHALAQIENRLKASNEIKHLVHFVKNSKRGIGH